MALRGLWRLAKTAIFSFSSFPLTVFYVIGYSSLASFLLLGTYALYCKALTDAERSGLDVERAGRQFLRSGQLVGHLHSRRIRDPHL